MYLNTHSCFSLRYGTQKVKAILEWAQRHSIPSIALTDINNTSACMEFIRTAPQYNVKPVIGIDFRNGSQCQFIGIAKNNKGWKELNDFLAHHLYEKQKIPDAAPHFQHAWIVYPFEKSIQRKLTESEFIGLRPRDLLKLNLSAWAKYPEKWVALTTATFHSKRDFNAHRLLRCIDHNTLLSKLPETEQGRPEDLFLPPAQLHSIYKNHTSALSNAQHIIDNSEIHFHFGPQQVHNNLKHYTRSAKEDEKLLRTLCQEGLSYRYPHPQPSILERIEKELKVIIQKGFVSYFLINWDILKYARKQKYFYVGRGSGVNSIVAYLLRITDVDPIDLDLYFERFINLYRQNPPDFDIDFSWTDRDDIIRYIFERFEHVALLATYATFQRKAVMRALGKVFGLPKTDIDRLTSEFHQEHTQDHLSKLVLTYSRLIEGFPSHLSIHAGGILISEKSIHHYSATFMPPKGYPTTQFDMHVAEDIGLYKFDILSQRGLGKIKDAIEVIATNHPYDAPIDIHDIQRFKKDSKVKKILSKAEAIGCFYVESPAMRMLLKKLCVDDYLGLVAASSVIRPGVAQSGMMREYILRFRDPKRRSNAHPVMLNIMPETFGVMVYQEDVIKVAHYFGGLNLGEADILRRGMSGKFRDRAEFKKVRRQFYANCHEKGYAPDLIEDVWSQIESFGGYAFAKGHSASYAVESFQSLFLKAHYPLEYMVATINNFGGFYKTEFYFHEAKMLGASIHPPCVNRSQLKTVIQGKDIYIGYMHVHSLETKLAELIERERRTSGLFRDFDDFLHRLPISIEQVSILIRIHAFRFTGKNKYTLLWEAHLKLTRHTQKKVPSIALFKAPTQQFSLPHLQRDIFEDAFDEIELLGFPVSCSPFDLLKSPIEQYTPVREWPKYNEEIVITIGYMVAIKKTETRVGAPMYFGTFLDCEGSFIDTVHFPPIAKKYPFRGRGIYALKGRITQEFDFYSMEIVAIRKMSIIEDPRYSDSSHKTYTYGIT